MAELTMRFDLRVPPFARSGHAAQYRACLDMSAWAERCGFRRIILSEHHGDEAGYTPAPLTLAAAVLARTGRMEVLVAALLVPLHDPVRLAEQLATLDCLAPGRISVVVGAGYRRAEFDMAGIDRRTRGQRVEECVGLWRQAWTGKPFTWRGCEILVTPAPATPGGPRIMLGGKSEIAARRAARLGCTFFPANNEAALATAYHDECRKVGYAGSVEGARPGQAPQAGFVMISNDPESTWQQIGPNALYDAATYATWQDDAVRSSWVVPNTTDLAALRASGRYLVVTPLECRELALRQGALTLHPLMGGIAPDLAWESLRLFENEVLPFLA